jgi:ubiquinone/menaquinone biosynthesis C-methylase UbiE
VSPLDNTQEQLIATYRKKAKHYNIVSQFYPVPGYPQRAQRRLAVKALGLRTGDTVVDVACGTGQNFPLIEHAIGPEGRIVGVDLTDAMLAQAQRRTESNGWRNISLVQADAADFAFPAGVDAILSTYALSHVPECEAVIAHGAAALSRGGRWVVLDLKAPDNAPPWLTQFGIALGRPLGSIDAWIGRRSWEGVRVAMQDALADASWRELCFGTAFLAVGSPTPGWDRGGHSATSGESRPVPSRSQGATMGSAPGSPRTGGVQTGDRQSDAVDRGRNGTDRCTITAEDAWTANRRTASSSSMSMSLDGFAACTSSPFCSVGTHPRARA